MIFVCNINQKHGALIEMKTTIDDRFIIIMYALNKKQIFTIDRERGGKGNNKNW